MTGSSLTPNKNLGVAYTSFLSNHNLLTFGYPLLTYPVCK